MAPDKPKFIIASLLVLAYLSYTFFLYAVLPVRNPNTNPLALTGKEVWQKYNCNACHQVYGQGGFLGPDLTNIYSLKGDAYIRVFIANGTDIMPKLNLSDQETTALLMYLKDIDKSGKSDPRTFKINMDGTISQ